MKLPSLENAVLWQTWQRPLTVAWWIEQCSGTTSEMRDLAYVLQFEWLGYHFFDLDGMLKEVVRPLVSNSPLVRREIACQACGESERRVIAHHINYRRPLDVYWICDRCHSGIHSGGLCWLDDESVLSPDCQRTSDTFSTDSFPLLDALWNLRGELEPLIADRIIDIKDEMSRARRAGHKSSRPAERLIEPAAVLLRRAVENGWQPRHMLDLIRETTKNETDRAES